MSLAKYGRTALCASLAHLLLGGSLALGAPTGRFSIDEQQGKFLIDGKPLQVISGEMHYPRIPPEYWRDRLLKAKAMGLNTIATYVFWNVHEPRPGEFDFRGAADVAAFVRMAGEVGLYVILRPGPYVCAEWEFGGFPAWLLKDRGTMVRSLDARFMQAADRYLKRLGQEVAGLLNSRGGPIIMVQVENEYGSYDPGNPTYQRWRDKLKEYGLYRRTGGPYLERLLDITRKAGFDVPLFTADGPIQMPYGMIPGVLPAVNEEFIGERILTSIGRYRPKGPYFLAEFYPGWLDHWGEPHARVESGKLATGLDWALSRGISINFYMFHGGTTFGFMNGANYDRDYQPQTSSYDYDAPLDEAGRITPKFIALRDVIRRHLPAGTVIPEAPPTRTIEIPRFEIGETALLSDTLPAAIRSERPLSMEDVGQAYGYIWYRTRIPPSASGRLAIAELRDYAVVLLDGRKVASLDRRKRQNGVDLKAGAAGATLDLLVENVGRINSGGLLADNRKGITESVTLDGRELTGWEIFPLPMQQAPAAAFARKDPGGAPALRRGSFQVADPADTFLDMRGWEKGCVFVNGHNLGRYWSVGPQQTLYLPGVWLKKGVNEIVIVAVEAGTQRSIQGLREPVLNQLVP